MGWRDICTDDTKWYYLIDLGYDIVRCQGKEELASKHLKVLRKQADVWSQITTGKRVTSVPFLVGCYYDYNEEERIRLGYPQTFGITPTLLGDADTQFTEWTRIGTRL